MWSDDSYGRYTEDSGKINILVRVDNKAICQTLIDKL